MSLTEGIEGLDDLEFECPRCGNLVAETLYGPCGPCISELRATQVREAEDVEAKEYEPKMNVTPNAIATKE